MNRNERLIRSYIRESLLVEDDFNNYGAMERQMSMEMPHAPGSASDLYNTFVKPFVNVGKTAIGKAKEVTRKARTVIEVGLTGIITTIIPGISADYSKIFEREKADIEKIKSEYQDVYDSTREALTGGDAQLLGFLANPAVFLGTKLAQSSPEIAKTTASILTGGTSDDFIEGVKNKAASLGRWAMGGKGDSKKKQESFDLDLVDSEYLIEILSDRHLIIDSNLIELYGVLSLKEDKSEKEKNSTDGKSDDQKSGKNGGDKGMITLEKILKNKKFQALIANSPKVKEMSQAASAIAEKTASEMVSKAQAVLKASSLQDILKSGAGEKIDKKLLKQLNDMPPDQKKAAESSMLQQIKKASKKAFVQMIEGHLKSSGSEKGTPVFSVYSKALAQVKGM